MILFEVMYEQYWGFKEKPFQNTPDPRFFYESSEHEEVFVESVKEPGWLIKSHLRIIAKGDFRRYDSGS